LQNVLSYAPVNGAVLALIYRAEVHGDAVIIGRAAAWA